MPANEHPAASDRVIWEFGPEESEAARPGAPNERPVPLGQSKSAACTCAEHEACSDPGCRGPYYTEVEFWTRTAVPSDAELRKVVVRDADS